MPSRSLIDMRVALGIEYDGSPFMGWQRLGHGPSVQATLEAALSRVADDPIKVTCAGRTDSGVHAWCQVVHFDTRAPRSERAWILGGNSHLPRAIVILWAREVAGDFHARFAALSRRYRYRIINRSVRTAYDAGKATWERRPLDVIAMQTAANHLLGEHDFSAFRAASCQARTAHRRLDRFRISRQMDNVLIEIEANAFLHHMVRNMVGSLLPVGRDECSPVWIAELLAGRDRTQAGPTAPADGLVFVGPRYPQSCGLPVEVSI